MNVIFDRLRIANDGQLLLIDAHVSDVDWYKDIYIKKITICTDDQLENSVSMTCPGVNVFEKEYALEDKVKSISLGLTKLMLNERFTGKSLSDSMFFVYVECQGYYPADIPCGMDVPVTMGVVFDDQFLYETAMGYTQELSSDCQIPSQFVNFILNMEALRVSLKTHHYPEAIRFWHTLRDDVQVSVSGLRKGCGCHG